MIALIDRALCQAAGFHITPALAALLSDNPLFLAALQRLAFAALASERKEG